MPHEIVDFLWITLFFVVVKPEFKGPRQTLPDVLVSAVQALDKIKDLLNVPFLHLFLAKI
jgi:hypothetical protein